MESFDQFGQTMLIVSLGFALAVVMRPLAARFGVPAPALLLVAAAAVSDLFDSVAEAIQIGDVQGIATVALIVILFDGGAEIGWRRFRASATPILSLGIFGTFATAAGVAAAAHWLLGMDWTTAGLVGAAIAPTDPAVVFSVLGGKSVKGRSVTILQGESGANDPVGIALMIGLIELATTDGGSFWIVIEEFAVEMAVGLAVGVAGAAVLGPMLRRLSLPQISLYSLLTLAAAGVIYGFAATLHGSGFLAVFVTGILVGDVVYPARSEVVGFMGSLASAAEIVVFVALGLTVDLTGLFEQSLVWDGLLIAAVSAVVIRPVVVAVLLLPARLTWGERGFIAWSGLKGAVPILLASLVVISETENASEIYGIVFVVVLASVVVQGTGVPFVRDALRVPTTDDAEQPAQ